MMDGSAKLAKMRNEKFKKSPRRGTQVSEPAPAVTTKEFKNMGQDGYEMYMARAGFGLGFK